MSICTRRGDEGLTDLMFGKRVEKTHPRVEGCGAVDELNAVLGVVRSAGVPAAMEQWVDAVQMRLVGLMGVIATHEEDHQKYTKAGYSGVEKEDTQWLEQIISEIETENDLTFKGWVRPGEAAAAEGRGLAIAYLDLARTICRRAERAVWRVEDEALGQVRLFLNRLSDALWLVARAGEAGVDGVKPRI